MAIVSMLHDYFRQCRTIGIFAAILVISWRRPKRYVGDINIICRVRRVTSKDDRLIVMTFKRPRCWERLKIWILSISQANFTKTPAGLIGLFLWSKFLENDNLQPFRWPTLFITQDTQSLVDFQWSPNGWPWMTLNGYFTINSGLRVGVRYFPQQSYQLLT